ncbi:MAG: hypothetical protein CXZ00_15655 [Acidobacteria bacterium]|nr:MAG: hypothetical protein CXZ00_15655 [Acidobacteriota bacterium]
MQYSTISKMAEAGFLFAPTAMGMTRSNREGWPQLATNNKKTLQSWITEGNNLVSVAKHGHGFAMDIDDIEAVLAKGFKLEWLDGYYLVDTPSGGIHGHGLHSSETEALGNLVVVYEVQGDTKSKKIFELKLNNQSVAAPTAIRQNQPKKKDGEYQPRTTFTGVKRGLPPELLAWVKQYGEPQKSPVAKSGSYSIEFHPKFSMDDLLDHHDCTEYVSGEVDGAFHVVVETCPVCGKDANGSTLRAGITKFIFGGNGFGFICHACGIATREELDEKMDATYEDWEPWGDVIYRHEDLALFIRDAVNDPSLPVEFIEAEPEPQTEPTPEPGTTATAEPQDQRLEIEGDIKMTELGNAKRLVKAHGHNLHYCQSTKKWYLWSGKRWCVDEKGRIIRLAAQVVQAEIAKEIPAAVQDARRQAEEFDEDADKAEQEVRKRYRQWILASESKCALEAMVGLAKSERGISVRITDFDQNSDIFNVGNGTIDLRTGYLYKARRSDLNLKTTKVEFDPEATCPKWEQFLKVIFNGNTSLIEYIQRVIGYSLTANTAEQCYFLMYGTGANGKSTLLKTIGKLMGGYAQAAEFSSFIAKQQDAGIRNDLAALCGARMVTASEADQNKRMSEGVLKQLTGEDAIKCSFLYGELFEYFPTFKLFLATNHKPKVIGQDYGFWRRVRLIPFTVTIPKEQQNKGLNQELEEELPGILNWALEGLRQWRKQGLNDPQEVLAATQEYRDEEDALQLFIEEECEVSTRVATQASTLYRAYNRWVKEAGEYVMGTKEFSKRLQEKGFVKKKKPSGFSYQGIGLRFNEEMSDEAADELASIN